MAGLPSGARFSLSARLILAVALLWSAGDCTVGAQEVGPLVTYAGALDQDGCPDCCQFSCRLTPTPTPEFDGLGRRVFQRSSGRFQMIVEGGLGLSLRPPSTGGTRKNDSVQSLGGFSRPGLQVTFDNDLGDGSFFVECGGPDTGGIPSSIGLSEAQITNAMIETACRFEWVPESAPCTRDRFGTFSTLSEDTEIQYCFQVTEAAEFPAGETVVQIRLMDSAGNLGPVEEIVVRVGTPAPTPTPLPGAFGVEGSVFHYSGGDPVPDVVVSASTGPTAQTNANGFFSVQDLAAATVEIAPRKGGGVGAAVSGLDAAYVLQANAGMRSLTTLQRLACDVTGDGTVSNLDASEILKLQVGLTAQLPVTGGALCDSDWAFYPVPVAAPNQTAVPPSVGGGSCALGAVRYDPLSGDASGQSFFAVPFGDCTGNWTPSAPAATSAVAGSAVRLGRVRRSRTGRIKVPLYADVETFRAATVELAFDGAATVARRLRTVPALKNALVVENRTSPGRWRFAIASGTPVDPAGRPIAVLTFRGERGARIRDLGLTIEAATLDEG